tara:strand:- start:310 stop:516 length:207 start_codon:yes stop_codon:yes gene_type:complete
MDLPRIIQLYALITAQEEMVIKQIPQKKLREQPFVPIIVRQNKPKVSVEGWLNKNLKGFLKYMIEYSE